jgi:hypothetical protein
MELRLFPRYDLSQLLKDCILCYVSELYEFGVQPVPRLRGLWHPRLPEQPPPANPQTLFKASARDARGRDSAPRAADQEKPSRPQQTRKGSQDKEVPESGWQSRTAQEKEEVRAKLYFCNRFDDCYSFYASGRKREVLQVWDYPPDS